MANEVGRGLSIHNIGRHTQLLFFDQSQVSNPVCSGGSPSSGGGVVDHGGGGGWFYGNGED